MLVHFVTDEPNKIPAIRVMLEPQHAVEPLLLGAAGEAAFSSGVLVVDADLRKAAPVQQLKTILRNLGSISEKLFIVQSHLRDMVAQAFALGATAVISRPGELVAKLSQIDLTEKSAKLDFLAARREIVSSAESFSSLFSA